MDWTYWMFIEERNFLAASRSLENEARPRTGTQFTGTVNEYRTVGSNDVIGADCRRRGEI